MNQLIKILKKKIDERKKFNQARVQWRCNGDVESEGKFKFKKKKKLEAKTLNKERTRTRMQATEFFN